VNSSSQALWIGSLCKPILILSASENFCLSGADLNDWLMLMFLGCSRSKMPRHGNCADHNAQLCHRCQQSEDNRYTDAILTLMPLDTDSTWSVSRNVGVMWLFRQTPVIRRAVAWSTTCIYQNNDRVGDPGRDSVAVAIETRNATCYEVMDKSVHVISWHRSANWVQLSKLVETAASNTICMTLNRQLNIESDTKVP